MLCAAKCGTRRSFTLRQAGEKAIGRSANRRGRVTPGAGHRSAAASASDQSHTGAGRRPAPGSTHRAWLRSENMRTWLELAREAEPLAKALNDPRREALVHCSMSSALSVLGRSAEAIEHGERALAIAESLREPTLRIIARHSLGLPYYVLGAYRTAIELLRARCWARIRADHRAAARAVGGRLFQEAFTRLSYSIVSGHAALCFAELGEFDQALLQAERA